MVDKKDWRLLNDVQQLKRKYANATDGEEIISYDKILDVLEAGKTAYEEKGHKYDSFKGN